MLGLDRVDELANAGKGVTKSNIDIPDYEVT